MAKRDQAATVAGTRVRRGAEKLLLLGLLLAGASPAFARPGTDTLFVGVLVQNKCQIDAGAVVVRDGVVTRSDAAANGSDLALRCAMSTPLLVQVGTSVPYFGAVATREVADIAQVASDDSGKPVLLTLNF